LTAGRCLFLTESLKPCVTPDNNTIFSHGEIITLQPSITEPLTTIQKAEFFDVATKIGESSVVPFHFSWCGASGVAAPTLGVCCGLLVLAAMVVILVVLKSQLSARKESLISG